VCTKNVITTRSFLGADVGTSDGEELRKTGLFASAQLAPWIGDASLDERAAVLGDGSHWSLQFREGAIFSNAGQCRKGSADDTVFWAWRDAGNADPGFTCASVLNKGDTIGTGCTSAGPSYK
jgi:hypothetical protein